MNIIRTLLASFILILMSSSLNAQEKTDFFADKWTMTIFGTPNGDINMLAALERKEGKLGGTITAGQESGGNALNISNIEEKENALTMYFNAEGYDIEITVEKKDENNLAGSMMGMFDVKAVRAPKKEE